MYVLLGVEYNGTRYGGWQRQGKQGENYAPLPSVQTTIETAAALSSATMACRNGNNGNLNNSNSLDQQQQQQQQHQHQHQHTVSCVQVSGRTDKGVHALDQQCALRIPCDEESFVASMFLSNINQALPNDVHVWSCHPVPAVKQVFTRKRYKYVIQQPPNESTVKNPYSSRPIPHLQGFSWYVRPSLNLEAIQEAMSYFVGRHDFQGFANETGRTNTTRTIFVARAHAVASQMELPRFRVGHVGTMDHRPPPNTTTVDTSPSSSSCSSSNNHFIVLEFEADGFLQHQVRRMVSVLRKIGEAEWPPKVVRLILQGEPSPSKPPSSAPSRGLYLDKVWLATEDERRRLL